jgi:hypothetical protein
VSIVCPKSSSWGRSSTRAPTIRAAWPVVERWASRELLDAHLVSDHVAKVLERAEELFGDSADIVVYAPLEGGEPKKGSLAQHAGG